MERVITICFNLFKFMNYELILYINYVYLKRFAVLRFDENDDERYADSFHSARGDVNMKRRNNNNNDNKSIYDDNDNDDKENDGGEEAVKEEIRLTNERNSIFVPCVVISYDITDPFFKSELSSIVKQIFYSFYALLEDRCYVKGGGAAEVEVGNSLLSSIDARFQHHGNNSSSRLKSIWKIGGSAVAESLIEVGEHLLYCDDASMSSQKIDCFRTKAQGSLFHFCFDFA